MQTKYFIQESHINNLIEQPYYRNLILMRNCIELACDKYFQKLGAPKIDLFLIAKGISSPIGKGSDSLPVPLKLGTESAFLVDSAQFGMEPLVCNGVFDIVYCYLPSFRGENPDSTHLNQFYHCESELSGNLLRSMSVAEELIKHLIAEVIEKHQQGIFEFSQHNFEQIEFLSCQEFPIITFDEAVDLLSKHSPNLVESRPYGRVLTRAGELKIAELVGHNEVPIWITHYDRDTVPFYQKPDPDDEEKVQNGDLILPSMNGGFGGEVIGAGERQDNIEIMRESIIRQEIDNATSYDWYFALRDHPQYRTTSGFGLGIERFIAWMLGLDSIVDAAVYPVIKNGILT